MAVRVPPEIRDLLEAKAAQGRYSSLTDLLRQVLTEFALDSPIRFSERTEACKQLNNNLGHDNLSPPVQNAVVSRVDPLDQLLKDLRSKPS